MSEYCFTFNECLYKYTVIALIKLWGKKVAPALHFIWAPRTHRDSWLTLDQRASKCVWWWGVGWVGQAVMVQSQARIQMQSTRSTVWITIKWKPKHSYYFIQCSPAGDLFNIFAKTGMMLPSIPWSE